MQAQHYARIVFRLVHDLFVVCVAEECKEGAFDAQRRLDDIGNVTGILFLIEIA